MQLHPTVLTRLLDEIDRLRGVLGQEHTDKCQILREGADCTCGCLTRATEALLDNTDLRAQLKAAQQLIIRQRVEFARLDMQLHQLRQSSLVSVPGTNDIAAAA